MKKRMIIQNKRGAFTDLFLLIIFAFIIIVIFGIYIYMSGTIKTQLHKSLDSQTQFQGDENVSQIIDQTFGMVDTSMQSLYWLGLFIIVAMIISIFVGSYLVTTEPIYFVPYIFVVIIAILVSVPLANSYVQVASTSQLTSTYQGFHASNYMMFYLPIWVTVIGFIGGIIMFVRMKSESYGGGFA